MPNVSDVIAIRGFRQALILLLTLPVLLAAAGCASRPPAEDKEARASYDEANDPFEPINRYFFEVNLGLDKLLLRPVAHIYKDATPQLVQDGVRNFTRNLEEPTTFINDLLQAEPARAGSTFGRFTGNTLFGVGGFAAPVTCEGGDKGCIPHHGEDFGQTMAVYGVPAGPYLMLPVLGPHSTRHAVGRAVDSVIDPVGLAMDSDFRRGFTIGTNIAKAIDFRARNFDSLDEIERDSIDFYATVRSLYRQRRAKAISNGQVDETADIPRISLLDEDNEPERETGAAPARND